jgi:hypothetical protein
MRKALVVGINDYLRCPLTGCVNDANEMERVLSRDENGDINFQIKKVCNVMSRGDLRRIIEDCFSGDADVALFYFSGHGHIDSIGGYLVTPDYSDYDIGVSMHDLLEIIRVSRCKNKVVILDCCHSGFMGKVNTAQDAASVIGEGVTILTASRPEQPSMEVDGHGVFTALLLDALKGGAADVTGYITPGGIYAYIDKTLGAWGQRPVFKTNITQFTPLRRVTPSVSLDVIRKLNQYFKEPNTIFPLDPSYEDTNAPDIQHDIIEPHAEERHVKIFKDLQKLEGVGLIVPCDEEHMYFAAMKSKGCKLTTAGKHYWRLVNGNII